MRDGPGSLFSRHSGKFIIQIAILYAFQDFFKMISVCFSMNFSVKTFCHHIPNLENYKMKQHK